MRHRHPVNQVHHDDQPLSVRFAESVTNFMGSVRFVGYLTVFIVLWVALNAIGFTFGWDPYPFILLNLFFSAQATYAAPLILLAANRSAEKDRQMAEFDFKHNVESLTLLRALHRDAHGETCECLAGIE